MDARFFVKADTNSTGAEVLDRTTAREETRYCMRSRTQRTSYKVIKYDTVCKTLTVERANFIANALNEQEARRAEA